METLLYYAKSCTYQWKLLDVAENHSKWWSLCGGTEALKDHTTRRMHDTRAVALADTRHAVYRCRHTLQQLKGVTALTSDRMEWMRGHYKIRLVRSAMIGLRLEVMTKHRRPNTPTVDMVGPLRFASAIQIQRVVRGFVGRRWVRRFRVNRVVAALTIQKAVRVYLAKKAKYAKSRHRLLADYNREQQEEKMMWEEELATRYIMYHILAAIKIQKSFRRYLSRQLFENLRIEASRLKSKKEYSKIRRQLEDRRRYLAEEPARYRIRTEAAVMIQKHFRGMTGRGKARDQRHKLKISACLGTLQRVYRMKLAKRKLDAFKRVSVNDRRVNGVSRHRGFLLRCLGYTNKKSQLRALDNLNYFGLHPSSFQYNISILVKETIQEGYTTLALTHKYLHHYTNVARYRYYFMLQYNADYFM
jgi:hypothetical protein